MRFEPEFIRHFRCLPQVAEIDIRVASGCLVGLAEINGKWIKYDTSDPPTQTNIIALFNQIVSDMSDVGAEPKTSKHHT